MLAPMTTACFPRRATERGLSERPSFMGARLVRATIIHGSEACRSDHHSWERGLSERPSFMGARLSELWPTDKRRRGRPLYKPTLQNMALCLDKRQNQL